MKVKEIMTKEVINLTQFMSLKDASELLARYNISGAPVVDGDGVLIGILTEADILRAVSSSADKVKMVYPSLHTMGVFFEMSRGEVEIMKAFEEQASTVVGDCMTKKVLTCGPDDDLNDVARTLYQRNINRIPVVDDDNKVIGIVTRGDIVKAFCCQANSGTVEVPAPTHGTRTEGAAKGLAAEPEVVAPKVGGKRPQKEADRDKPGEVAKAKAAKK